MAVDVVFHKAVDPAVITQPPVTLTSEMVAVYAGDAPPLAYINRQLANLVEIYEHNESGWVFSNFSSLELTLWHLDPLRASAFVPLPRWKQQKKAVENVIGTGGDCFKWAVLAGMHPVMNDHPNRMDNYVQYASEYDFSSLCIPIPLSSAASFATKNNLSINVYGVANEKKVIYPLCVTNAVVPERHVYLLLHELGGIQHYSTIKNFSRLISGQLSNHGHAIYCCKKCLDAYSSKEMLAAHSGNCSHVQRTNFPKDPRCHFINIQKQLQAPLVIYADFESILKPVSEEVDVTQGVDVGVESSTTVFQEDIRYSFAYKIVSSVDPDFSRSLVMYRGEDAAEKIVQKVQLEAQQLCDVYIATPKPPIFNIEDSLSFTNATTCHICTKPLGEDKVSDHCHITGNYRGAAHKECELIYKAHPKSW